MKRRVVRFAACACAAIALLTPYHVTAERTHAPRQIVVRIDDVPNRPPAVTVKYAPHGYDLYTGPLVADPSIEDGGIITLYGVDMLDTIDPGENGWRFVDPSLPADDPHNAQDIVWFQHNRDGDGSLQIGFNTRNDGGYYRNPDITMGMDSLAGPAVNNWYTIYSDSTILLQFNPRNPVR